MWKANENKFIENNEIALIDSDYDELLFHDFPILFTGRNRYGERIVGSFVDRLPDVDVYLHSIVDEKTFSKFDNQIITYLELLKSAKLMFRLDFDNSQNAR